MRFYECKWNELIFEMKVLLALLNGSEWVSEWIINERGCWNIILWIEDTLTAFTTKWIVRGNYCTAMKKI
jgi:hypothetical protein